MSDTMIMGLRLTREGVNRREFERRFGLDLRRRYRAELEELVAQGLLVVDEERVRLSARGRLLGNQVFAAFI